MSRASCRLFPLLIVLTTQAFAARIGSWRDRKQTLFCQDLRPYDLDPRTLARLESQDRRYGRYRRCRRRVDEKETRPASALALAVVCSPPPRSCRDPARFSD